MAPAESEAGTCYRANGEHRSRWEVVAVVGGRGRRRPTSETSTEDTFK
jgi:hypothetical protein